ncbi:MAG: hypothetical protein QS721_14205 [Candidatus Endonucleobacter sp. (ex Gigantidas childressi)]|nr:hypothetical protein [Candidatus Endonucleobacter sp. (ex Gigantidas childressi)]
MFLKNLNYRLKIAIIACPLLAASAFVHAAGEFLSAFKDFKSNGHTLNGVPDDEAEKFFNNMDDDDKVEALYVETSSKYQVQNNFKELAKIISAYCKRSTLPDATSDQLPPTNQPTNNLNDGVYEISCAEYDYQTALDSYPQKEQRNNTSYDLMENYQPPSYSTEEERPEPDPRPGMLWTTRYGSWGRSHLSLLPPKDCMEYSAYKKCNKKYKKPDIEFFKNNPKSCLPRLMSQELPVTLEEATTLSNRHNECISTTYLSIALFRAGLMGSATIDEYFNPSYNKEHQQTAVSIPYRELLLKPGMIKIIQDEIISKAIASKAMYKILDNASTSNFYSDYFSNKILDFKCRLYDTMLIVDINSSRYLWEQMLKTAPNFAGCKKVANDAIMNKLDHDKKNNAIFDDTIDAIMKKLRHHADDATSQWGVPEWVRHTDDATIKELNHDNTNDAITKKLSPERTAIIIDDNFKKALVDTMDAYLRQDSCCFTFTTDNNKELQDNISPVSVKKTCEQLTNELDNHIRTVCTSCDHDIRVVSTVTKEIPFTDAHNHILNNPKKSNEIALPDHEQKPLLLAPTVVAVLAHTWSTAYDEHDPHLTRAMLVAVQTLLSTCLSESQEEFNCNYYNYNHILTKFISSHAKHDRAVAIQTPTEPTTICVGEQLKQLTLTDDLLSLTYYTYQITKAITIEHPINESAQKSETEHLIKEITEPLQKATAIIQETTALILEKLSIIGLSHPDQDVFMLFIER